MVEKERKHVINIRQEEKKPDIFFFFHKNHKVYSIRSCFVSKTLVNLSLEHNMYSLGMRTRFHSLQNKKEYTRDYLGKTDAITTLGNGYKAQ